MSYSKTSNGLCTSHKGIWGSGFIDNTIFNLISIELSGQIQAVADYLNMNEHPATYEVEPGWVTRDGINKLQKKHITIRLGTRTMVCNSSNPLLSELSVLLSGSVQLLLMEAVRCPQCPKMFCGTYTVLMVLTLWPWNRAFKQYHIIYVKCEYFTNQKK